MATMSVTGVEMILHMHELSLSHGLLLGYFYGPSSTYI